MFSPTVSRAYMPDCKVIDDVAAQAGQEPAPLAPQPSRRVILLSGEALASDCHFHLEGTIFVGPGGAAAGEFLWTNIDTARAPSDMAVVETVEGSAGPARLELAGVRIDPLLVCERYNLVLAGGAEFGIFSGSSKAYSAWDGRLHGMYRIVDEGG